MALKLLLTFAGWTPEELAQALGVGAPSISKFANGDTRIPEPRRLEFLRILGFDPPAWGHAEVAARRFEDERLRFQRRSSGDLPYAQDEEVKERLLEPFAALGSLDAETADDLAMWVGGCVEDMVQGIAQRLRDRKR